MRPTDLELLAQIRKATKNVPAWMYEGGVKRAIKCKKHPKYKAIRKPTADCQTCRDMWFIEGYDPGEARRSDGSFIGDYLDHP